jgi:hypothetical protein
MDLSTSISREHQALPGFARMPPANEYDEINAFLAEMALEYFQGLLANVERGPLPMEQAAAAPNYLRAIHAYRDRLELQLSTSNFPEAELEEVENQVQVAGIMGRPGLLRQEYHVAQRILKQRLQLDLLYLECMNLRLRGCAGEALVRLDKQLLDLQLMLEKYHAEPPYPAPQRPVVSHREDNKQRRLRFKDLVNSYLEQDLDTDSGSAPSDATLKKYRTQLKLISRLLANPFMDEICPADVQLLHKRLDNLPKNFRKIRQCCALRALVDTPGHGQALLGASTRASYQARARQIFRFAYREQYTQLNLAE